MPTFSPTTRDLKVKVNGVDITNKVMTSGSPGGVSSHITIDNALNSRIDQCRFGVYPADALSLDVWQTVAITDDAESTTYFGGVVTRLDMIPITAADGTRTYAANVDCQDYTVLTEKAIINYQWTDEFDDDIIDEVFTLCTPDLSEIDTTAISAIRATEIVKFRASRLTVRECMNRLADVVGADWYIDYDAVLHWFETSDTSAPFDLSDTPNLSTTYPFHDLKKNLPGADVFNRVTVVGSYYESDDTEYILQGTGKDERVSLPFKAHAPTGAAAIQVWRNDGTEGTPSWTAMTVKTGYIETLGGSDEVLHYFQEKALEQSAVWPVLTNSVKVNARFEIPLRVEVRNSASRAQYGRWLETVINDSSLSTKEEARLVGQALMTKIGLANPAYECKTWEPGLEAGQLLELTDSALGLSAESLLIQRVVTRWTPDGTGNFYVESDVQLGAYDPDLIDIILKLRRDKDDVLWRDDEVLDILLTQYETLTLAETTAAPSVNAPPYTWHSGANDFEWSFGVWWYEVEALLSEGGDTLVTEGGDTLHGEA
jgi:hypothetical protein